MPLHALVVGRGRPLVVLPGFGLDSTVTASAFEPVVSAGRAGPWRRIYLDLPGTNGSAAGEPTSAAVLLAVRQTLDDLLGDEPFRLAGHSYGGYLAAGLVRRDPVRVAGLLLICCGPRIAPADRDLSGVLPSTPEPGWLEGVPEELREHFGQGLGRQTRAVADRVAGLLAARGPADETYLEALSPGGYRLPGEDDESVFEGPVGLLAGRRDRIVGFRDSLSLLSRYPGATVSVLAHAGHYLPYEQPETFAALTLDWLASSP